MRLQPAMCGGESARERRLVADEAFRLCPPHRAEPAYLERNRNYMQKAIGGRSVLALKPRKSMQKPRRTYLPPNSQCMQKTVEGVYPHQHSSRTIYTLYKGAIDCTEHTSPRQPQPKPKNHKTTNADKMTSPKTSGQNLNVRSLLIRDS